MIRGQPSEQMGKNVPQKRSSKCSGSEVIVLRTIQRKKGAGVAGGHKATNGWGRWAGIASCRALPAELRNLSNDVSLKQVVLCTF